MNSSPTGPVTSGLSGSVVSQHIARAWKRHWPLQMASITVMTVVLVFMNFLFAGLSGFNQVIVRMGRGLEMIAYLKDSASAVDVRQVRTSLESSREFEQVRFVPKAEATRRFLTELGPDSLKLLSDPQWNSPIPSSFELQLKADVSVGDRVSTLRAWARRLRASDVVDDVFYGEGWVENFSQFLQGSRYVIGLIWMVSLGLGLLVVGNCIRMSFWQRKDEVEILELVGATSAFIRIPFIAEGLAIGLSASFLSLAFSYSLHLAALHWMAQQWDFWPGLTELRPMGAWWVAANLATGAGFGSLGAWFCVRSLNTGWSASAKA